MIIIQVRGIWGGILKSSVENETDFFAAGAGSMDVVRLIEEVKLYSCIRFCICILYWYLYLYSCFTLVFEFVFVFAGSADVVPLIDHQIDDSDDDQSGDDADDNLDHQHDSDDNRHDHNHHHQHDDNHDNHDQVKEASGVTLANEDVFMATQFGEFIRYLNTLSLFMTFVFVVLFLKSYCR